MADGLEITSQGLPEFGAMLEQMGTVEAEKICRRSLRVGGDVMKAAIAANAPVRPPLPSGTALPPGALQSDIQVRVTKIGENSFSSFIGFGKYTAHVARWVEWGHRLVRGKSNKSRKGKEIGDVPAHPFIRPAFDENEDLVVDAMNESIAQDLIAMEGRMR